MVSITSGFAIDGVRPNPSLSAIFHVIFLSVRLAVLHLYLTCTRRSLAHCLYRPNRTLPNPPLAVLDGSLELAITLQKKSMSVKRVVAAGAFSTNALRLIAGN
jgi:hypothetical protein